MVTRRRMMRDPHTTFDIWWFVRDGQLAAQGVAGRLFVWTTGDPDPAFRPTPERIALWAEQRAVRARIRFGERDEIVRRARAEERLERAA